MDTIFRAVREACTPETWSLGVRHSREGKVHEERRDDVEVVVRVETRGGLLSPTVRLYLDDDEWECDCGVDLDVCEHVAGAVIALRRAASEGRPPGPVLAAAETAKPLTYRFSTRNRRLAFERGVETEAGFEPIEAPLEAVSSGRVSGPRFLAARIDLEIDVALGTRRRGVVGRAELPKLFAAMKRLENVTLDGRPVRVSSEPAAPVVVVEAHGTGFRVTVGDDPDVRARFENGAVLHGDVLRPVGEPKLTAREAEELGRGRIFGESATAELVSEVLPSLRERMRVEVRTDRLPEAVVERPYVSLDVEAEGRDLTVLPTLVYGDPPRARVDGGRLVHLSGRLPLRDLDAERRVVRALRSALGLTPGVAETVHGEEAVDLAGRIARFGAPVRGQGLERFALAPPLVPRADIGDDRLELAFDVAAPHGGGGAAGDAVGSGGVAPAGAVRARDGGGPSPEVVLRAWRDGARLVELPGGGWSPLPSDWLARHGERVADLVAAREADGRVPPQLLPDLGRLAEALDEAPPAGLDRLRGLIEGFEGLARQALPDGLDAVLRPYQRRGVDWLGFLRDHDLGGVLADDMGLGKTVQTLAAIPRGTLVVAPTSVVHNWLDEVERYRPSLSTCVYHGPNRALDAEAYLTLTSYAILRLDRETLAARAWSAVVLDEAQAIKNPASQAAQAAFELRAPFRVALSGTPVENRLAELWSVFRFAAPGLLGRLADFEERYAKPIEQGDAETAERLRERIRPFLLRRVKRDVAPELPPRTDAVLRCDLDDDERAVYDAVRAATREDVIAKLRAGGSVLAALEALLRLRQAACHPALVPGQRAAGSTKVERLVRALENARDDGHRALVFSQWTSLLDLIEPHLEDASIGFTRLDGSTRDRQAVVREFQDPGGPTALLISLRAGGTGLNLTRADHVFLMDPWWNPAAEDQAADRAHRIGQDRPVMVYRMVASDTVEERILDLQRRKREIAEAATGSGREGGVSEGLTREDLLALLD